MATNPQEKSKVTKPAVASGELPDDTVYESSLVPLLWLIVPFVLVMLYGVFTS